LELGLHELKTKLILQARGEPRIIDQSMKLIKVAAGVLNQTPLDWRATRLAFSPAIDCRVRNGNHPLFALAVH